MSTHDETAPGERKTGQAPREGERRLASPSDTAGRDPLRDRIAFLEAELKETRERLRRLENVERMQSDFALAVSHELRTPLTLIRGYVQTLLFRWGTAEEPKRRTMVEKINVSSHRLARLIDDIMLTTDVERGELPVVIKHIEVSDVVQSALVELQDRYADLLPPIVVAGPPIGAVADGFRLEQVLISLLDNAVKHTPTNGTVMLVWGADGDDVVIKVSDEGPGIDREDIPRLFTRFGRLENPMAQGSGGVGLGLYIARSLIEAMNGRIWVQSAQGVGSTFSIALPASDDESM